jgi:hypothetical protein
MNYPNINTKTIFFIILTIIMVISIIYFFIEAENLGNLGHEILFKK